ncbi:sulfoxide reductase heme-binding subunit YedZ [Jannaschia sp. S6380]|uniref:sulfite oxidase heme-binding subunit YedZ n=1 Tax=Jannaschia sp. S6380 TaxID=2926408 RepID=UPI001FF16B8F|nr:protein-methionine-sulfoxide reductase heme-binding subunit MsrQ [Jannaschia sp. S6380]MCK0168854.1 sulfoxide reductase heme-binding subunit YedZ [Jannaschia sp. S6380]
MSTFAAYGQAISGAARKVPTWPVYMAGVALGAWEIWVGLNAIDPVEALELALGMLSLQFLLASLTITPLMRFARINLVKFRKPLGLLAFGFLTLHFLVWLALDLQLRWGLIGAEIVKRPYLTVGFAAFILLIPLAATSWQGAVRRLGAQAWGRLHRLVYVSVILGGVHFVMQEKVWTTESLLYLGAAILLVGMRLAWIRRW